MKTVVTSQTTTKRVQETPWTFPDQTDLDQLWELL